MEPEEAGKQVIHYVYLNIKISENWWGGCKMKILSKIENANDIPNKEFVDQKIVGLTEQEYEQLEEKKRSIILYI